ncbi:MAG TPA: sugar ABC transporter substrate-binding protein [Bacilli bacterium]
MRQSWKRLTALMLSLVLTLALAAGCGSNNKQANEGEASPAPGQAAETAAPTQNPQPYAGQTIKIVMANHPWADAIKQLLPQFEQETGIKVDLTSYFEDQLTQKLTVQFTSGSTTPDAFMYRPLQEGKLYYMNGWLEPLDSYVNKDAEYDFNDFSKSAVGSTTVDGHIAGVPIITEQEILYYRKDLLAKANLEVPKTIDELVAAAKKLHDPQNGIYGFVARGQQSALVTQVSSFIYSEGGDFSKDGKATVNTPEAIKGMSIYADLLKNYGPPGVANMSWPQAIGIFAQGKAAFYTDADSIYKNATDPSKSKIADQVGFAVFPAGDAGSKPYNVTSWGLAINSKSAHKDAAWAFVQWATSKKIVLETQKQGNPGARQSVWNDPEGIKGFPPELAAIIKEESQGGVDHDRPVVVNVGEARDAVGAVVLKKVLDENVDIQAEANEANNKLQAIIDKDTKK